MLPQVKSLQQAHKIQVEIIQIFSILKSMEQQTILRRQATKTKLKHHTA